MQRRHFIGSTGAALALLPSCVRPAQNELDAATRPAFAAAPPLVPVQARADRIIDISVCTRPFRARGPRIEAQRLGRKLVVHNYGHGGSGWSLSWGSAQVAVQLAQAAGEIRDKRIAVIGCGAIGLTSALVAQRAGLRVRIYARDRPPEVRSSAATGVWSPASRICTEEHATPEFKRQWEAMTRHSHHMFQSMLGLPAAPVEWCDGYVLSDESFDQPPAGSGGEHGSEPSYPNLSRLVRELVPFPQLLTRQQHPFATPYAARYTQMVFNLPAYQRMLMDDFMRDGGEIEQREFTSPRQFAALKERTIIHATGYGARALLGDESIVPVRGQTARLVPQGDVHYGITYRGHNLSMVPRRDGILVQAQADGDFNNPDATPDRAASEAAVARLATLFRA